MDRETLTQLQRTVGGVSEQYRQQIAQSLKAMFQQMGQLAPSLSAVLSSFETLGKMDWPKLRADIEGSCERLANLGWTLPMTFTAGQLVELAKHGNTDQEVEQHMLDYYTFESGRFFLELRGHVLRSANLIGWRALLEQCFDAYDRGHYLVLIPALLSVIEGAVAQEAGKLKVAKFDPKVFAADLENAAPTGGMEFLVWRSARVVLDKLFAYSNFGGPHPGELNRHWALHGRDQTEWTQTDAPAVQPARNHFIGRPWGETDAMFQAKNEVELLKVLAEADISVPPRSEGRTKEHTERYAIAHLLSALAGTDRISYPLSVTKRDRPDFLLTSDTSNIGIEHTEAIAENEAHKDVLREKRSGAEGYFGSHQKPGEPKRRAKELIREINANRAYDKWIGDSVEIEWAEAMFHFVNQKVARLLKDGFDRFGEDWLLIYDNWSPAGNPYKAVPFLFRYIAENAVLQDFKRIFIISRDHIHEIASDGVYFHNVNDLWI